VHYTLLSALHRFQVLLQDLDLLLPLILESLSLFDSKDDSVNKVLGFQEIVPFHGLHTFLQEYQDLHHNDSQERVKSYLDSVASAFLVLPLGEDQEVEDQVLLDPLNCWEGEVHSSSFQEEAVHKGLQVHFRGPLN
jgi:hypothetical protein